MNPSGRSTFAHLITSSSTGPAEEPTSRAEEPTSPAKEETGLLVGPS